MSFIANNKRYLLAMLTGFAIPVSTVFTSIFCLLVLIFLFIEKGNGHALARVVKLDLSKIGFAFALLVVIGLLYSSVGLAEAAQVGKKYRQFLFIPLFLVFFQDDKTRQWGLGGFLGAMGFTLFLSSFISLSGLSSSLGGLEANQVFTNYITQNLLMAIATYFVAINFWSNPRWKWPASIVILLAVYNILFISSGRTGYVIFFCLVMLLAFQTFRLRGFILASILLGATIAIVYISSPIFQERINNGLVDLERYQEGDIDLTNSIGSRLEFDRNSLRLFRLHPIIGTGTGSFPYEYGEISGERDVFTRHPHNEYLLIAVQWGSIGLGLFLYFLFSLCKGTKSLSRKNQLMAQGLTLTIIIGCLFNSLWLDSTESHIFAYLIGIFYAESVA